MSNYLKGAWKVFSRYSACLLLFLIFAITFFQFRYICTFTLFLVMFFLIYFEMNGLAFYEKNPRRGIKNYALKGLVIGILGFLPFIILTVILLCIKVSSLKHGTGITLDYSKLKHSLQVALLCPLYIPLKIGGESTISYIVALTIVPLISAFGYMTGYMGFEFKAYLVKTFKKKKSPEENKSGGRNAR